MGKAGQEGSISYYFSSQWQNFRFYPRRDMVGFVCFIQQKRERLSNFMTTSLLIKMKGKIISPFRGQWEHLWEEGFGQKPSTRCSTETLSSIGGI